MRRARMTSRQRSSGVPLHKTAVPVTADAGQTAALMAAQLERRPIVIKPHKWATVEATKKG
jgi:hypothetical protein